ncbi:CocE/NonD family hydrolase [Nocardia sp. NPDC056100]|uniref:CocE/NonD family hydrolase n=1 Tax=Nocardia sp. NPDC056100 TaxID=3345712 RepID=UPI0035DE1F12
MTEQRSYASRPERHSRTGHDARFEIGPAQYPAVRVQRGAGIRISDGATLSADIFRPARRGGDVVRDPLPAVVTFTPYNKTAIDRAAPLLGLGHALGTRLNRRLRPTPGGRAGAREVVRALGGGAVDVIRPSRTLISRGYVYVHVDVRGTGSSTGVMGMQDEREQQDFQEVLAWVREQPWCDGTLGLSGISYSAMAALLAAGRRPPGLKAVFAVEGSADFARDLMYTGGAHSIFIMGWLGVVNAAKWAPTVPGLMKSGVLLRYLRDRAASPATKIGAIAGAGLWAGHPENFYKQAELDRRPDITGIDVPTWVHGGWHDLFDRSNPLIYQQLRLEPGAKQLVMDDAYHATPGTGFGTPGHPQRLDELQCAWFDRWTKGIDNGIDRYGPVTLRRLGGEWVTRDEFADPAASVCRWYLSAAPSHTAAHAGVDGSLTSEPGDQSRLTLPRTRTGPISHNTTWVGAGLPALLGRKWVHDNRTAESSALAFTSAPFEADTLLHGPANLHLTVLATGTEAFWAVTVCDVAPDGTSTVLTRGALKSSRRAVDELASTRVDGELLVAVHPLTAEALLPVVPGVEHELDIDINATEAVLRAGHRLRVTVARTSWPRYVLTPATTRAIKGQQVVLDPERPSYLSCTVSDLASEAVRVSLGTGDSA